MTKKDNNTFRKNPRKKSSEKVEFELSTDIIQKETSMKAGTVESKSVKKDWRFVTMSDIKHSIILDIISLRLAKLS